MSNPTDTIRRGLAARGHKTDFASLESVVGCPLTFEALSQTISTILNRRTALQNQAVALNKQLAAYEAATRKELSEMGIIREEKANGSAVVSDTWGPNQRKAELTKRVAAKRKELMAQISESRAASMRAVNEAITKLNTVRNLWTDAKAFLDRNTVTESSLRIYKDNLRDARPKKLESVIKQAVARGDKVMVAAALDILDGMDPELAKQVNVDRTEAAALAAGTDYIRAQHFISAADLAHLEVLKADAEISGGQTSQLNIQIGLARREVAAWAGEEYDPASVEKEITDASD